MPPIVKLQLAQYVQGELNNTPLTSLSQAGDRGGFTILFMLPRGGFNANVVDVNLQRAAEEFLDEEHK